MEISIIYIFYLTNVNPKINICQELHVLFKKCITFDLEQAET